VGLDPVLESVPAEVRARHHEPLACLGEFCRGVLESVSGVVPAVKMQSACFERYGSRGVALLEETIALAVRLGLLVVLDAKRGDIGTTSAHYAESVRRTGAHAVTVNGYLGVSGITPFLDAGLGVFVLVRTSNKDSDAFQGLELKDGRSVAEAMAEEVRSLGLGHRGACGLSGVGAVVGATKSGAAKALRERMPEQVFLVPGYGAQGGTAADVRDMIRPGAATPQDAGVLVTASRSVIYAQAAPGGREEGWRGAVGSAARELSREVRAIF
jgi:orotidine-5'-phosphate decarboxylase